MEKVIIFTTNPLSWHQTCPYWDSLGRTNQDLQPTEISKRSSFL